MVGMNLKHLTPEYGEFDLVMACDVLEHLPDPAAFMDVARAMSRGILVKDTQVVRYDRGHRAFGVKVLSRDGVGEIEWIRASDEGRRRFEQGLML